MTGSGGGFCCSSYIDFSLFLPKVRALAFKDFKDFLLGPGHGAGDASYFLQRRHHATRLDLGEERAAHPGVAGHGLLGKTKHAAQVPQTFRNEIHASISQRLAR